MSRTSTIISLPDQRTATLPKRSYLNGEHGLLSWLLTGDHQRIATMCLISITFFFGGLFANLVGLLPEYPGLNVLSTAGATVLGLGCMIPLLHLGWSLRYGALAGNNPRQATGLEWQIQPPPITANFIETPFMDHEAYDYLWLERMTRNEVTVG